MSDAVPYLARAAAATVAVASEIHRARDANASDAEALECIRDASLTVATVDRVLTAFIERLLAGNGGGVGEGRGGGGGGSSSSLQALVRRLQATSAAAQWKRMPPGGIVSLLYHIISALEDTQAALATLARSRWDSTSTYAYPAAAVALYWALRHTRLRNWKLRRWSSFFLGIAVAAAYGAINAKLSARARLRRVNAQLLILVRMWLIAADTFESANLNRNASYSVMLSALSDMDYDDAAKPVARALLESTSLPRGAAIWPTKGWRLGGLKRGLDTVYAALEPGFYLMQGSGWLGALAALPVTAAAATLYLLAPSAAAERARTILDKPDIDYIKFIWRLVDSPPARWLAKFACTALPSRPLLSVGGIPLHLFPNVALPADLPATLPPPAPVRAAGGMASPPPPLFAGGHHHGGHHGHGHHYDGGSGRRFAPLPTVLDDGDSDSPVVKGMPAPPVGGDMLLPPMDLPAAAAAAAGADVLTGGPRSYALVAATAAGSGGGSSSSGLTNGSNGNGAPALVGSGSSRPRMSSPLSRTAAVGAPAAAPASVAAAAAAAASAAAPATPAAAASGVSGEPCLPPVMMYIHGGGFVGSFFATDAIMLTQWAAAAGAPFAIAYPEYSLSPEAQYPTALNEVLEVYLWLRTRSPRVIVAGESAGGNLATALTMRLIDAGLPPPDGLVLCYPALCLNPSPSPSRSLHMNDPLVPVFLLLKCAAAYISPDRMYGVEGAGGGGGGVGGGVGGAGVGLLGVGEATGMHRSSSASDPATADGGGAGRGWGGHDPTSPHNTSGVSGGGGGGGGGGGDEHGGHRAPRRGLMSSRRLGTYELNNDPFIHPVYAPDSMLRHFPTTHIISGGLDPLLDDAIDFNTRLRRQGVAGELTVHRSLPHGFLYFPMLPTATEAIEACRVTCLTLLGVPPHPPAAAAAAAAPPPPLNLAPAPPS